MALWGLVLFTHHGELNGKTLQLVVLLGMAGQGRVPLESDLGVLQQMVGENMADNN